MKIVPITYEGTDLQFQEDGWRNITLSAQRLKRRPVLYCIQWSNGVCKVGRTKNILSRLKQFRIHGINQSQPKWFAFHKATEHCIGRQESVALGLFSKAFTQIGAEVFIGVDRSVAKAILRKSVCCLSGKKNDRLIRDGSTEFLIDAIGKAAKPTEEPSDNAVSQCVDFVLWCEKYASTEDEFLAGFDLLPMEVAFLVDDCIKKNCSLLLRDIPYDKRKEMLGQYAADYRLNRAIKLVAA